MQDFEAIKNSARSTPRAEFASARPGFFIIKRPRKTPSQQPSKPTFSYATVAEKMDIDPFAQEWQVFPVAKRAGNPFPERITIGRAPNCDISLRAPFISKAHAHIVVEADGSLHIRDNQGANGTFHNRRRLEAGEQARLNVGDHLRFSSLEFEFVDASRLHDILMTEARA
jgi:predicted component of type VI protein secretion system